MTSEVKYISFAAVATMLMLACFPAMFLGLILLMPGFSVKAAAIYLAGLIMWVAGNILGNQQKQQLVTVQIVKKAGVHFGLGVAGLLVVIAVTSSI